MNQWKKQYPLDPATGHVWHVMDGEQRCLKCAARKHWPVATMECNVPTGGPWAFHMLEARWGRSKT